MDVQPRHRLQPHGHRLAEHAQVYGIEEREEQRLGDAEPGQRAIDIWIGEAADLGRGYGTRIMELALARCFREASVEAVLIDPLRSREKALSAENQRLQAELRGIEAALFQLDFTAARDQAAHLQRTLMP